MVILKQRRRIRVTGLVQGVGFRPFVYRLALACKLSGWVANTPEGVSLEIEGDAHELDAFCHRLTHEHPPVARIESLTMTLIPPMGGEGFTVRHSDTVGYVSSFLLPDLAPCPRCVEELFDPANRRYRYPFISCTHCGPRWSLITGLPFDRERTTMATFALCPDCTQEYRDPSDRRFHAQTQCCPACGPQLIFKNRQGHSMARADAALQQAVERLRRGDILALKGVGGYQLVVDARNEAAVRRLRARKNRPAKPLAVMSASVAAARAYALIDPLEQQTLESTAAPIVLVRKNPLATHLAQSLAPGIPLLGILLPASPLHHLLTNAFAHPLVLTSGNLSGEPLCIDDEEACTRLGAIADVYLTHDRPIQRPLDDSLIRIIANDIVMLRRGRGFSPTLPLPRTMPARLALGGHLKNTVALSRGHEAILSQHLGDLDDLATLRHFESTLADFTRLFAVGDDCRLVCDLHPDYGSTRHAKQYRKDAGADGKKKNAPKLQPLRVQHHYAHVLACLAEHDVQMPVLGVAFDGLGLGGDGTLWGGEFLAIEAQGFRRIAHFAPFPLPGGVRAVREPRRVAYALLYQKVGKEVSERTDWAPVAAFSLTERINLMRMLEAGLNSPLCSSVGRLFDAVASLLDLCQINRYEGEAAMQVEFAAGNEVDVEAYPFYLQEMEEGEVRWRIGWMPLLRALLEDLPRHSTGRIAARFQQTLAEIVLAVAQRSGFTTLALTGGVFQNGWLTARTVDILQQNGFTVLRHRLIPPNDGGLSLGQLLAPERADEEQTEIGFQSQAPSST